MQKYIIERILSRPNKIITYAEYMELALYHPEFGYYMKEGQKVGRQGDFITTSNISDVYGSLVAKWYAKLVDKHQLEPIICEIGAGNGRFASAFIEEWKKCSSQYLNYYIVEESPYHREIQKKNIQFDEHVEQISSIESLMPFNGLIFSNELFDALPVHVIEKRGGVIMEVMVSAQEDKLIEVPVPLENVDIQRFLEKGNLELREKQRIEIPLVMIQMIKRISSVLERGIVLTVDYGYSNDEWKEPEHQSGSLRGYYKHQLSHNVLDHPGEMDITSHIHLDSFIEAGLKQELELVKKLRQDEFFISIGLLNELQDNYDPNPFSDISKRNRALRSLIMPGGISSFFHAIIQQKGLDDIADDII